MVAKSLSLFPSSQWFSILCEWDSVCYICLSYSQVLILSQQEQGSLCTQPLSVIFYFLLPWVLITCFVVLFTRDWNNFSLAFTFEVEFMWRKSCKSKTGEVVEGKRNSWRCPFQPPFSLGKPSSPLPCCFCHFNPNWTCFCGVLKSWLDNSKRQKICGLSFLIRPAEMIPLWGWTSPLRNALTLVKGAFVKG